SVRHWHFERERQFLRERTGSAGAARAVERTSVRKGGPPEIGLGISRRHGVVVRETSVLVLLLVLPLDVFLRDPCVPKLPAMPALEADVPAKIQVEHVAVPGIRFVLAGLLLGRGPHRRFLRSSGCVCSTPESSPSGQRARRA